LNQETGKYEEKQDSPEDMKKSFGGGFRVPDSVIEKRV
jgi:hypothetical protein